jgi:uncharacterized protein (DUF1501 family)
MLTLLSNLGQRDCGQTTRRDFLRIGALGLGGLALPSLFAARARANPSTGKLFKDRSIIFLFLCGGASQIETFDPKMDAPEEFRSTVGEIKTTLPGVTFGSPFPKLAKLAHKLAIIRSYQPGHGDADHARAIRKTFQLDNPMEASIGSIAARIRGSMYQPDGMPRYASLIDKEADSQDQEDEQRMTSSDVAGSLGAAFAPFTPRGGTGIKSDMTLNVPLERLNDRRALLEDLDRLNRKVDASGAMAAMDEFGQRAVEMVLGGKVRHALDLKNEDPRVVERYDTSRFTKGWVTKSKCTLGERLLIARRLCEAGCGFVTVGMAGWDQHGNDKHPGVKKGTEQLGAPLDHAVSAFLEDVEQRGLSDKITLVITSEFGRTPRIQKVGGGRDHWPGLCPLVFAGGGLKVGQVVGKSTAKAEEPASEPIRMKDMLATLLHTAYDLGEVRVQRGLPREMLALIDSGRPIPELV